MVKKGYTLAGWMLQCSAIKALDLPSAGRSHTTFLNLQFPILLRYNDHRIQPVKRVPAEMAQYNGYFEARAAIRAIRNRRAKHAPSLWMQLFNTSARFGDRVLEEDLFSKRSIRAEP